MRVWSLSNRRACSTVSFTHGRGLVFHTRQPSERKKEDTYASREEENFRTKSVISDGRVTWERVSQKLNILTARRRGP